MVLPADLEILRPDFPRGAFRSVLFDFDGTLSLLREGWPLVMIPMMVRELHATGTAETEAELTAAAEDFVMHLNGRQTIYQMIQLAEEVRRRGGQPLEPLAYKHRYHDLLMERIRSRLDDLHRPRCPGTVGGAWQSRLLEGLRRRGAALYLASGTDLKFVREEADILGLTPFFDGHVYGALDDYRSFSSRWLSSASCASTV